MVLVRPSAGAAKVEEHPGRTVVTVPARRHWFGMLFLPVWLVGWAFGAVSAITQLTSARTPSGPTLFLVAWLTLWIFGGVAAAGAFLWMLAGKQVISLERGCLSVRWDLMGLGTSREYDTTHITNLRVTPGNGLTMLAAGRTGDFWGLTGGPLTFDYGARTIRIGLGMDEAEATRLLPRISSVLTTPNAG